MHYTNYMGYEVKYSNLIDNAPYQRGKYLSNASYPFEVDMDSEEWWYDRRYRVIPIFDAAENKIVFDMAEDTGKALSIEEILEFVKSKIRRTRAVEWPKATDKNGYLQALSDISNFIEGRMAEDRKDEEINADNCR